MTPARPHPSLVYSVVSSLPSRFLYNIINPLMLRFIAYSRVVQNLRRQRATRRPSEMPFVVKSAPRAAQLGENVIRRFTEHLGRTVTGKFVHPNVIYSMEIDEINPGRVTPARPHPSACTVSGVLG